MIDVNDIALGHTTKMRWNDTEKWIYSDQPAHAAIVADETFCQVQRLLQARPANVGGRRPRRTERPYLLRGLLFCGLCGRRMQGSWNNDRPYYRCRAMAADAGPDTLRHPRAIYLREAAIVPRLDAWLAEHISTEHEPFNQAVTALAVSTGAVKAAAYAQLGLHMTLDPDSRSVLVRAHLVPTTGLHSALVAVVAGRFMLTG